MLVYKFGGTSVGSVVNMNHVKDIINTKDQKIVVLSAMSGTTNALVEISRLIEVGEGDVAKAHIKTLHETYTSVVNDLLQNESLRQDVHHYVNTRFEILSDAVGMSFSQLLHNEIVANGELLSTYMFSSS